MINTEYIRNLNCNFERVLLEEQPDHKRYQYCIVNRGGMKYLLPCSYKYIDGNAYLYYDITSSQNVKQMFAGRKIQRQWIQDFLWSVQKMRQELTRFLLDERNIVWSPEHIYQDLEKNHFRYMYIPYYGQDGYLNEKFDKMLEFWVENIDYEDDTLVEFVYHAYEQYLNAGDSYLEKLIFEDFDKMETLKTAESGRKENTAVESEEDRQRVTIDEKTKRVKEVYGRKETGNHAEQDEFALRNREDVLQETITPKRGLRHFMDSRKKKQEQKSSYREDMRKMINGYTVREGLEYGNSSEPDIEVQEEYGKTIYIEEREETVHKLMTDKGEMAVLLTKFPFVLGKKKEDVDYVLSDYSSSRVHARFIKEEDDIYIEDLNSTNGTYKNGLRLQPYEKRKLEGEDTLRFGKSTFVFR